MKTKVLVFISINILTDRINWSRSCIIRILQFCYQILINTSKICHKFISHNFFVSTTTISTTSTTTITMRNIQTLTDYVKNRFGSNTRIILSEQGFSSTYGGQANQAAAIALAYYKAACNPMIDAFIIRSYKDEAHEVAQGLAMGLKDANGKKKTAYNVFKNMDSSNSLKYTEKVLKSQVGNWKSLVPGYSTGKISSMYRK